MGSINELQAGMASLVIDPDGDVLFVLKDANKQIYIWPGPDESATTTDTTTTDTTTTDTTTTDTTTTRSSPTGTKLTPPATTQPAPKTIHHFQVSSRRLSAASPVWAAALADSQQQHGHARHVIEAEGWNADAVSALLDIIHERTSHVHRTITLDLLTKVAVLVHHYKCHDSVRETVSVWFDVLSKSDRPKTASTPPGSKEAQEEAIKELFVAWEFSKPELFARTAQWVIYTLDGAMETMGLPFMCALVYAIDNARHKIIEDVLDYLLVLLDHLAHPARVCPVNPEHSEKCSALLLGQLIRFMRNELGMQVLDSLSTLQEHRHPVRPFYGLSVAKMQHRVRYGLDEGLTSCEPPAPPLPELSTTTTAKTEAGVPGVPTDTAASQRQQQPCSLKSMIQPLVENAIAAMQALQLEDFTTTSTRPGRSVAKKSGGRARRVDARRKYTEGHLRLNTKRDEHPRRSRGAVAKSTARAKTAPVEQ